MMSVEHRIQSESDAFPKAFVCAKWLAYVAIAMTPLMPVVTAWKQMHDELVFSFAALAFVPFMAGIGYWVCRLIRLLAISRRDDEGPNDFFPSNWPFPFSLVNIQYRFFRRPHVRQVVAAIELAFINFFVVLWCGFLLFWVVAGLVLVLLHA